MSGNYSFVVDDKDINGFFESISFQFVDVFAPWTTDYLGSLIYPEHILGDQSDHGFDINGDFNVSQWLVQPADWASHSTSTGRTSDAGGYAGPIGTGSMIFKEFNPNTWIVTLEKFENMIWNGSDWVTEGDNDYYNIANLADMPRTATIIISSLDAAIAGMKIGDIVALQNISDIPLEYDMHSSFEGNKTFYRVQRPQIIAVISDYSKIKEEYIPLIKSENQD